MTAKVILNKKSSLDTFGYLVIRYFNGNGKKKVISIGEKINESDFNKLFNSDFNQFKQTTLLDYKTLNKKISEGLNDVTIFDEKAPKKSITSFLDYYKEHLDLIANENTKASYRIGLRKLDEFKTFKGLDDILFTDIDNTLVIEIKNFFTTQLSGNTAKQYLTLMKVVLNRAKKDGLYNERWNYFEKLKFDRVYKNKKILNENDIKILMSIYPDSHKQIKYYDTRNMLLFSMFSSGLRVSDLLLIRNKDFKKGHLEVTTKKTSISLDIPYNDKLIGILLNIFNLYDASLPIGTGYMPILDKEQKKTKNTDYNLKQILKHIETLPQDDFLFSDFMSDEPSLKDYRKSREMTLEQTKALYRMIGNYNHRLKLLIKKFDLEIDTISSHTGRYSWTNLLLDIEGVNLVDIQRSLGHKSLGTTEKYIEKNFNIDRLKNIGAKLSDKISDLDI